MRILVAPDSFKGTLRATAVCRIWQEAFAQVFPQAVLDCIPMSDGGEGALDAVLAATGARAIDVPAEDALCRPIRAAYALLPDGRAFVETAAACGLELLSPQERNPMEASSYGAGMLIADAVARGARDITVSIGGSATVDGGVGMMQALGFEFVDALGRQVPRGGKCLAAIQSCRPPENLGNIRLRIACDVTNPLCGPSGAAAVFGPQKGATPEMVRQLEAGLARLAQCLIAQGLADDAVHPGDGAAGGMGFILRTLLHGESRSGAELIADLAHVRERLAGARLLITGEGRSDSQTLCGKLPFFLARLAAEQGVPTLLCSGAIEDAESLAPHFAALFSTVHAVRPLEAVLADASGSLRTTARSVAALLKLSSQQ